MLKIINKQFINYTFRKHCKYGYFVETIFKLIFT